VLTGSRDGTARLWDAQTGREICAFYVLKDGGWLTFTPQAFVFDGSQSTRNILLKCLWIVDNSTGQRRAFTEADFERFHRPELVARALARQ
jgi:WD40 repeat protein